MTYQFICKGCGYASETDVLDGDDLCFGCANDLSAGETLEERRAKAIENDEVFSKSRLHNEFRMKPKKDAQSVKSYKNDYGGRTYIYKIADCIPLREVKKREPTAKELLSRQISGLNAKLRSNTARVGKEISNWFNNPFVVLDTETTGLDHNDQIIEIAVLDQHKNTIIDTRLKPTCQINPEAQQVHGISIDDLQDAPIFPEIYEQLKQFLTGKNVVIFNADFDIRLIKQTAKAFNLDVSWINEIKTICAMYLSADAFGATNRHGTISLSNAVYNAGKSFSGAAHSAKVDVVATIDVIDSIHDSYRTVITELNRLKKGSAGLID